MAVNIAVGVLCGVAGVGIGLIGGIYAVLCSINEQLRTIKQHLLTGGKQWPL